MAPDDSAKRTRIFEVLVPAWKKLLLALPAATGWLLHAPLYYPVRAIAQRFLDNDHFDSAVVALLLLLYPVYLLLVAGIAALVAGWPALLLLLLMPFCAWAFMQLQPLVK
jgi:hypothetical protein